VRPAPLLLPLLLGRLPLPPQPAGAPAASASPRAGCCCSPLSGDCGPFAAAAMAALSLHCRCCSPPAGVGAKSMMTTVMLSLLPLSTAALVSTVAATRAAALREAPFSRARLMERRARSVASWLLSTSHSPSLASSRISSRGWRANTEIYIHHRQAAGAHEQAQAQKAEVSSISSSPRAQK
jgi:hypothetical protein